MIAEDIIAKLKEDRNIQLTKVEASWLLSLVRRTAEAQRNNEKYYRVNDSMTNRKCQWTLKDIEYLKESYENGKTDKEIAEHLKRSTKAIERKRHKLNIRKPEYYLKKEVKKNES